MKAILLSIVALLFSSVAFSQTTTFYKDQYLYKQVSPKKANYKKVIIADTNGIESHKVYILNSEKLFSESNYKDGKPYGTWTTYNSFGTITGQRNFNELIYLDPDTKEEAGDTTGLVFPSFPGGNDAMFKFLVKTTRFPAESLRAGTSGKVYIKLTVDETGQAKPVGIFKGADTFMDYEAWKLIEKMPRWSPATKNGKPIEFSLVMPFVFNIK